MRELRTGKLIFELLFFELKHLPLYVFPRRKISHTYTEHLYRVNHLSDFVFMP